MLHDEILSREMLKMARWDYGDAIRHDQLHMRVVNLTVCNPSSPHAS